MSSLRICSLVLAVCCLSVNATESKVQAIGFFVESPSSEGDETPESRLANKFVRDGKEYEAMVGYEVFPGDLIMTGASKGISIALLDSQAAIRLHTDTQFEVAGYNDTKTMNATLRSGHASVTSRALTDGTPSPAAGGTNTSQTYLAISLGFGTRGGNSVAADASVSNKFDIVVGNDGKVTIAVIKGSVGVTPSATNNFSGKKFDLTSGNQAILTQYTNDGLISNGVTSAGAQTVTNILPAAQILELEKMAASVLTVSINKLTNVVTIKNIINNPDGSQTGGTTTEINGVFVKDNWQTIKNGKTVATWTETQTTISLSRTFNGFTIYSNVNKTTSGDNPAGTSSSAYIIGPGARLYKGTTTINSDGVIQFTSGSTAARDGSKATFTFTPGSTGKPTTETLSVFNTNGTYSCTVVTTDPASKTIVTTVITGTYVQQSPTLR